MIDHDTYLSFVHAMTRVEILIGEIRHLREGRSLDIGRDTVLTRLV